MDVAAPILSVVVVTWNCAGFVGRCLALLQSSGISGLQTIVVDNASSDDTCGVISRDFPSITLLRSPENLGFARANNMGLERALGKYVLLLNPDAMLVDPNAIGRMVEVLEADAEIGMVGCRLVFEDGRHQVGDAGFRPSSANLVSHGLALAHLLPWSRSLFLVRPDRYQTEHLDVDWVCGACLMVRRALFDTIGGFDDRFFQYAEDVEWGCRARGRGSRVVYLPHVSVVHLGGQSEKQSQNASEREPSVRWLKSLLDLYVGMSGKRRLGIVRTAFSIGFGSRALAYWALAAKPERRSHYLRRRNELFAYSRAARLYRSPSADVAQSSL